MRVKIKTIKIEVKRPFCPNCKTEIKSAGMYKDQKLTKDGVHYEQMCDCSVWQFIADFDLKPEDRYIYLGPKHE